METILAVCTPEDGEERGSCHSAGQFHKTNTIGHKEQINTDTTVGNFNTLLSSIYRAPRQNISTL